MRILFNGQPLDVPTECPLDLALEHAASVLAPATEAADTAPSQSCATAVNGRFVTRARRPDTRLADGDQVTTFQAIVGG